MGDSAWQQSKPGSDQAGDRCSSARVSRFNLVAVIALPALATVAGDTPETALKLLVIAVALTSIVITAIALLNPDTRMKLRHGRENADQWIDGAITRWVAEGRISGQEAARARAELAEPQFHSVLPHLGVHIAISVVLRFPFGSIARATYTLSNLMLASVQLLTKRVDRAIWRRVTRVHSPIVVCLGAIPGFGALAYIASKPLRSHPLLLRIGMDEAFSSLPWRLYERTGLQSVIARAPDRSGQATQAGARVSLRPRRLVAALGAAAAFLVLADVITEIVDHLLDHPSAALWRQAMRLVDLNAEASFGTWLTIVMLITIAGLLAVAAVHAAAEGNRFARHWAALVVLIGGISIDEQAKIHDLEGGVGDWARERLGFGGLLYFGWVIVAAVTIVVIAIAYRHFIMALPAGIRLQLIVAGAFYVAGEVGVEMVSGWVIDLRGNTLAYQLFTSLEEGLSLVGMLCAIHALMLYVREHIGIVHFQVARETADSRVERAAIPGAGMVPAPLHSAPAIGLVPVSGSKSSDAHIKVS